MQETQIWSLGQEDALKKEMATHPLQYFCLGNPNKRGALRATVHGFTKSWTRVSDWTTVLENRTIIGDKEGCYIIIKWKIPPPKSDNLKCLCIYKESIKMYEEKPKKNSKEKQINPPFQQETPEPLFVRERPRMQKIMRM